MISNKFVIFMKGHFFLLTCPNVGDKNTDHGPLRYSNLSGWESPECAQEECGVQDGKEVPCNVLRYCSDPWFYNDASGIISYPLCVPDSKTIFTFISVKKHPSSCWFWMKLFGEVFWDSKANEFMQSCPIMRGGTTTSCGMATENYCTTLVNTLWFE